MFITKLLASLFVQSTQKDCTLWSQSTGGGTSQQIDGKVGGSFSNPNGTLEYSTNQHCC